jgi:hypothetical protein
MDEGGTAMRMAVRGYFTPGIDETHDNAASDENAVYFEDVHTGLLRVHSEHLSAHGVWGQRHSLAFLTGVLL